MKPRLTSRRALQSQQQKKVSDFGDRGGARYGERASYTATEAKNEFGRVLEQAIQGTTVVITKHDSPRAVLISIDQFNTLSQAPQLELNTLREQFDVLLARMQAPEARAGMEAAFNASAEQLGKAAVAAARKRA